LSFAIHNAEGLPDAAQETQSSGRTDRSGRKAKSTNPAGSVDKSVLMHPEPRRIRDREHVRFVIRQSCLVCERTPCDVHHLRFAQNRALGRKVSDEFTVPLCRGHHRELHRYGDEVAWWHKLGLDPNAAARLLRVKTRTLHNATSQSNESST
jgi:hypothetical protein